MSEAHIWVAPALRFLLPARHRNGEVTVRLDGSSSLGHVVESLGVPRTEVGELRRNGQPVDPSARPRNGDLIEVLPVTRPQLVAEHRFVLDVHLGALARRMRLLGLDTAYRNNASDEELVEQAVAERRVLLTQDRGLLRRRRVPVGAYVRGDQPDDQLADVLDRFDPPIDPWSRCLTCNGKLQPVDKSEVQHLLEPGTRRTYAEFARCEACGRPYWRGAHSERLTEIVAMATARQRR